MSGGSFDYAYGHVSRFADELEDKLDEKLDKLSGEQEFSPEVIAELRQILTQARRFAEVMHAVEWLYDGDYGEKTFLKKLLDIELKRLVE